MVDETAAALMGLIVGIGIGLVIAVLLLRIQKLRAHAEKLQYGEATAERSLKQSKVSINGKVGEQIASLIPILPYNHSDVRFLGSPVDLVVFDGLSGGTSEINVVFVEARAGEKPGLNEDETRVKNAIDKKRVRWELFRPDLHEPEDHMKVDEGP
jgi:predicted Holliday junction resolvase-like endonuclease